MVGSLITFAARLWDTLLKRNPFECIMQRHKSLPIVKVTTPILVYDANSDIKINTVAQGSVQITGKTNIQRM